MTIIKILDYLLVLNISKNYSENKFTQMYFYNFIQMSMFHIKYKDIIKVYSEIWLMFIIRYPPK